MAGVQGDNDQRDDADQHHLGEAQIKHGISYQKSNGVGAP